MEKIKKIEVTKGIYWLEIAEVKMFILCACPADVVKHLMQGGLIVNYEENGVVFESGPNVILLSDLMLQNGYFSNLGEFPVLQMLYRQGMILPGHPNNTGIKPMLLGSQEQIDTQMQYIYRGNYGLVSREEVAETGIPPEMVDDVMQFKLKFAFGKIHKSEELLDSLIITHEAREIRDGVLVRRRATNVFEFNYQGETVVVDLNLGRNDAYPSPYPLGFHNIKREYFGIIHSGQGDGWDVNRPSMSSILMYQGKVYLIDAGPNLSYCLMALGIGVNEIEGIFQTHSHDDHFSGLTTLLRTDHKIKFYSTPLVRSAVFKKLSSLLNIAEDDFTDFFEMVDLEFDRWNNIEGLEVKPFLSPHPVETSIFTFRTFWGGEYLTYGHFGDIVSMDILDGLRQDAKDKGDCGISAAYYERVKKEYLQPMDLKKLDIGGGMIHGKAEDFSADTSKRIILAHTAKRLSCREKEIGSSAPFGIVDVMIPDNSDSVRRNALKFLEAYFPTVPNHQLQILVNNEINCFKPGTLFLKEGTVNGEIYLLLTGNVEMLNSKEDIYNLLSSGEIVGEHSGLYQNPSRATFRTVSYVHALSIPVPVYLRFVKQNRLYAKIERIHENREFLQQTWLFGEGVSYPTQNMISKEMDMKIIYNAVQDLEDLTASSLYIVQSGQIEKVTDNGVRTIYSSNQFFGAEGSILGNGMGGCRIRTLEPSTIYIIPCKALAGIPIVRWKLLEEYRRRLQK